MAKSLNPHAAESSDAARESAHGAPSGEARRAFLGTSVAAGAIGAALTLFPLGSGALVLLDPLRKRKTDAGEGGEGGAVGLFLRVATIDSLPVDGTPVQVPVIADLTDAWNREANQPIGAVYLSRSGDQVKCFNAICPHAGCFVGYAADRKVYQCPCHTSSFNPDGSIIAPSPSPRDMDELEVDAERLKTGEVWIRFVNYLPGKHDRIAK